MDRVTRATLTLLLLLGCGVTLHAQSREQVQQYVHQIKASGYSPQVFSSLGKRVIHCWVLKLQAQGKASVELGALYLQARRAMDARDQAGWGDHWPFAEACVARKQGSLEQAVPRPHVPTLLASA
jgi:hypothetical protein